MLTNPPRHACLGHPCGGARHRPWLVWPRRRPRVRPPTTSSFAAAACSTAWATRGSAPTSPSATAASRRSARWTDAGAQEIDATGRYVSPGWIDMMDQSGGVLPRNGLAENKLRMGVTTAIGGEGGTPVPAERVAEYFADLERDGISINFGSYYSETQARTAVLGNTARAPTADELARMQAHHGHRHARRRDGHDDGAHLSAEQLRDDRRTGRDGEGGGAVRRHLRQPHPRRRQGPGDGGRRSHRHRRARGPAGGDLPPEGGVPARLGHADGRGGHAIEAARARGVDVAADLYVYTAGGTGLEATIPAWAQEGGRGALWSGSPIPRSARASSARSSTGAARLVEHRRGRRRLERRRACRTRRTRRTRGSRARRSPRSRRRGARTRPTRPGISWRRASGRVMAIYHMMSEPDVETALRFPWTSIGSDAGAARDRRRPGPDRACRTRAPTATSRASSPATCASAGC